MFAWYRNASRCYAYLADVQPGPMPGQTVAIDVDQQIVGSRWFTRGWTLQELLAPKRIRFYAQDWSRLGTRSGLADVISAATGIDKVYLTGHQHLGYASVAKKLSWLSSRVTSRVEDMAYCMLGIFGINMPLLYGEGSKAFIRLQEEIIKVSTDHTIFCWTWTDSVPQDWVSMLAPSPEAFKNSGNFARSLSNLNKQRNYSMTNAGLAISFPVIQAWSYHLAILNAKHETENDGRHVCIPLRGSLQQEEDDKDSYAMVRWSFPPGPILAHPAWALCQPPLLIQSRQDPAIRTPYSSRATYAPKFAKCHFHILLDSTKKFVMEAVQHPEAIETAGDDFPRLERTKIFIGIETYPAGMFNAATSMVTIPDDHKKVSGVLVKLGLDKHAGCIIFLAVVIKQYQRKHLRFCRTLSPDVWNSQWDELRRKLLLDKLMQDVCDKTEDEPRYVSPSFSVALSEESVVDGIGGPVSLTYITTNRDRLG